MHVLESFQVSLLSIYKYILFKSFLSMHILVLYFILTTMRDITTLSLLYLYLLLVYQKLKKKKTTSMVEFKQY